MSEGNVFGQPKPDYSKRGQMNVDDRPTVRVPLILGVADPNFGGAQKTQMSGKADPNLDAKREFRIAVQDLADERERLVSERSYLIDTLKVDPDDLEPIDGFEAIKALHEAHPLLGDQRVELDLDQAKATEAALKLRGLREALDSGVDPRAMPREQVEAIAKPVVDYVWDGADKSKDSNPKEAFGSRKAGLSTISRPVLYEVGLAMLEGALKYGRHNYRIAGVRASTYFDACGRHMDAWWEGQDIDPDSKAKLHHITKAIAGLTVIRDSMIMGNWTDDRPPSIADPNWLAWYNEQAEILVDACKHPKKPFVKGDNE